MSEALKVRLSNNHWTMPQFRQRMTTSQWRALLLAGHDTIVYKGRVVRLIGTHLGSGVVEVSKEDTP